MIHYMLKGLDQRKSFTLEHRTTTRGIVVITVQDLKTGVEKDQDTPKVETVMVDRTLRGIVMVDKTLRNLLHIE